MSIRGQMTSKLEGATTWAAVVWDASLLGLVGTSACTVAEHCDYYPDHCAETIDGSDDTSGACNGDAVDIVTEMAFIQGGSFEGHTVADFYLDETEVTVAAYQECVCSGECEVPDTGLNCNWNIQGKSGHPVNCVSAYDADGYCVWAGKYVPTEWEWEWAAQSRSYDYTYPWGHVQPGENRACWSGVVNQDGTCQSGSFPLGASVDGVMDLAGNVWEWTSSTEGASRVIRGGSFLDTDASVLAASFRHLYYPSEGEFNAGFRCARVD